MSFRALVAVCSLAFVNLTGCGENAKTGEEQNDKTLVEATITFDAEFGETVDGRLVDGGRAVLAYDDERVADCKGEQSGVPQYAVTAYYKLDDGEVGQLVVAGLQAPEEPSIDLDGAGRLEVWFEVTNRWGCHMWDSNFGDNYVFEVEGSE